jgi:F-type H+-transporting ATPase subunit epsilon
MAMAHEQPSSPSADALLLTVLSPEIELLSKRCSFVALPAYDGELGVMARHAPLVARLGFGELRLRSGGQLERHFISGGYVQVKHDEIVVLTEQACDAHRLDPIQIESELAAAQALPVATPEQCAARQRAIDEAQLKRKVQRAASGHLQHTTSAH